MIKIFDIYLIKRSFLISFLILVVFGFLDSIFNLISELENSSNRYDILNIFKYVIFSAPHRLIDYIEGACLLGVMISLGISHQEGNLNVMRSAGKSPLKIVFISSLGALCMVIPYLIFDEVSFRETYNQAEVRKNVILQKDNFQNNEVKWIKYEDSYLAFSNIIDNYAYQTKFIKIQDKKVKHTIKSNQARIEKNNITFEDNLIYKSFDSTNRSSIPENFEIPVQSKIAFKNINHLGMSEMLIYRKLFSDSNLKKDKLFKSHLDKALYKKIFMPISIIMLLVYFGSLIFTSLRNSTLGGRIIVAVIGAFIFKLAQDLSVGIFISYSLPIFIGVIIPTLILFIMSTINYKDL